MPVTYIALWGYLQCDQSTHSITAYTANRPQSA